jgi:hypothetical protein
VSAPESSAVRVLDDAVAYVRANPALFVKGGEFDPLDAAQAVARVALEAGADAVDVRRLGRWWVIAADKDWLADVDTEAAFHRITPLPSSTPNRMRPEVLLTAFARTVATAANTARPTSVRGRSDRTLANWWAESSDLARMVAFKI